MPNNSSGEKPKPDNLPDPIVRNEPVKMMKIIMKKYYALLLICLSILSVSGQTKPIFDVRFAKIRDELQSKVEKGNLGSVAIGVIKNGKIIWKETFGWEDRQRKIPASAETIYALGSLSKSITATGVWLLAERGKLSVDDAVEKRLKSVSLNYFQGLPADLKIRHLLNMEGGIPHQLQYYYDADNEPLPSLPEQIRRYGFVAFPPGTVHNYSNFSMAILDQLIADTSGKGFAEFMRQDIFRPLGMKRTFVERPDKIAVAKGYDKSGNEVAPNKFLPRGGAGMYSTLDDLLQYGLGHLNQKKLLKEKTLSLIHSTHPSAPNPYYSSGWGVFPADDGRTTLLSDGAIAGSATTVLLVPQENLVIVCLTNTTVGSDFTDITAFNIANVLIDGYSDALGRFFAKAEAVFGDQPFVADESFTGDWRGKIKTAAGDLPLRLNFNANGEISVLFNNQAEETIKNSKLESGLLRLSFRGLIPTPETMKSPHHILLKLKKIGNKMFGVASAVSDGKRAKFFLPFYVELIKDQ
jgi:CubicO group peptidase (beta-lactamase class C family)